MTAKFLSWSYATIAGIAVFGLTAISYRQFTGTSACPAFGVIPACYVLLVCYVAIAVSAFLPGAWRKYVFWPGWVGVFIAAAMGSSMELAGHITCPRSAGGTPTCYYSLAMAVLIVALHLGARSATPPGGRA